MMEMIFNLFKVKFVKLDEIISFNCKPIKPYSTVNVFINMENIINKLATSNVDEYLRVKKDEKIFEFISNIINLAAHYKLFFTKNKINAKIYLYMPYPFKCSTQKNNIVNPEYRKYFEYRFNKNVNNFILAEMITSSLPFIKLIFEYIGGVYFIESGNIENSVIPYIIMDTNEENDIAANFIISGNQYDFQYVNQDCNIIIPKQANSKVLTRNNVIDIICNDNEITNTKKITSNHLTFILSIIGNKPRNIKSIKGIGVKKTFKMINTAINQSLISESVDNINILITIVKPEYIDQILENFYCTDIEHQFNALVKKDIYSITSQLIDKYDNDSLKIMNDKYFVQYPIQLIEITSTVTKKKNVIF